ncbi:hypothetical protein QUB24_03255 [Microcoleus sp. B9-D4]
MTKTDRHSNYQSRLQLPALDRLANRHQHRRRISYHQYTSFFQFQQLFKPLTLPPEFLFRFRRSIDVRIIN